MTAGYAANMIEEILKDSTAILSVVSAADPAAAVPIEGAELLAALAAKALTAWSNAAGTPITAESIQALLPNQAPLSAPDAGI